MLVTRNNFDEVLLCLAKPGEYGLDTETTGLTPWQGSRLFSLIVASEVNEYYFNFNLYKGLPEDHLLLAEHKERLKEKLFSLKDHTWYIHNAKFDMGMLYQEGIELAGPVHCTYAMGRVLRGDLMSYSLDALSKRWLNADKDDAVADYIDKHKLYSKVEVGKTSKGTPKYKKNGWYHKVPLEVMQPYAELDTRLCYKLGKFQVEGFKTLETKRAEGCPSLQNLVAAEKELTKVLFDMEKVGVKVDKEYCKAQIEAETKLYNSAVATYKEHAGKDFYDSYLDFKQAFLKLGLEVPSSIRGGFDKFYLAKQSHPIAKAILQARESHKKITTYYKNFLDFSDDNSIIHPNFRQAGTKTGRMSCSDPNLQNLTKNSDDLVGDDASNVRRAFVPLNEEYCFFLPDFKQMEYYMMLNYAEEKGLIELIKQGLDVHTATAELVGIARTPAKVINFLLIYGGGVQVLADKLGRTFQEAKEMRDGYFGKLPKVKRFIDDVQKAAVNRGYCWNWAGRRYVCSNAEYAYTMPNYVIQGGCADLVKLSMVESHKYLLENAQKSKLFLQVHDELGFLMHKSELEHCQKLMHIMENVYVPKLLPMACDPSHSWKSLGDKVKGFPTG